MTKPMLDLSSLVEKSVEADLLREMIGVAAERRAQRNGYRDRSTHAVTADARRQCRTAHPPPALPTLLRWFEIG